MISEKKTTNSKEEDFLQGLFVRELSSRFLAEIEIDGKLEICYVPSSCKLGKLMDLSGRETLLLPVKKKNARTKYSVFAVKDGANYILLNLGKCNAILEKELHRRYFSFLGKKTKFLREANIAGYKTDLFIKDTNTIVEIKSVLSNDKKAMFPSVHSRRALLQLDKISKLLDRGYSVCYVFASVNPKTKVLYIDEANFEYCKLFRECVSKGMKCCAVSIGITDDKAEILAKLKVEL